MCQTTNASPQDTGRAHDKGPDHSVATFKEGAGVAEANSC